MIGRRFNRLTIIAFSHLDKRHRKHFLCRCDCGQEKTVQIALLKSGNTRSCGCLAREVKATLHRLPNDAGVINQIILQYKRHAKGRGIPYNLDYETFASIIRKPCVYCGDPASNNKVTKNCAGFKHNGVDRVNSTIGYEIGNVVPCCYFCNRAKANMPAKQFIEWARRIVNYQEAMAEQWGKD